MALCSFAPRRGQPAAQHRTADPRTCALPARTSAARSGTRSPPSPRPAPPAQPAAWRSSTDASAMVRGKQPAAARAARLARGSPRLQTRPPPPQQPPRLLVLPQPAAEVTGVVVRGLQLQRRPRRRVVQSLGEHLVDGADPRVQLHARRAGRRPAACTRSRDRAPPAPGSSSSASAMPLRVVAEALACRPRRRADSRSSATPPCCTPMRRAERLAHRHRVVHQVRPLHQRLQPGKRGSAPASAPVCADERRAGPARTGCRAA